MTGNPGKRPLPESELDPGGEPVPTKSILRDPDALEIWDQYAPMLTELGVLTRGDSHSFSSWCHLTAEFETCPRAMSAARINVMRALASDFGLNPSSRTRMPGKPKSDEDPEEKFFSG